jgi:hypothetical protein
MIRDEEIPDGDEDPEMGFPAGRSHRRSIDKGTAGDGHQDFFSVRIAHNLLMDKKSLRTHTQRDGSAGFYRRSNFVGQLAANLRWQRNSQPRDSFSQLTK